MKAKINFLLTIAFLCLYVSSAICEDKPKEERIIKVAVLDTGIHESLKDANFLCKFGHKDFTGSGNIYDNHGHGTHIAGLIDQYAKGIVLQKQEDTEKYKELLSKKVKYCIVVMKYYDPRTPGNNLTNTIKAIQYAINLKVDIINYSGGGTDFSKEEEKLVKKAIKAGIKYVAAAGNERSNLNIEKYYPASIDGVIAVGNLEKLSYAESDLWSNRSIIHKGKYIGIRAASSNYGNRVDVWKLGTDIVSYKSSTELSILTGTSQAAAIETGEIVKTMLNQCQPNVSK